VELFHEFFPNLGNNCVAVQRVAAQEQYFFQTLETLYANFSKPWKKIEWFFQALENWRA